MRICHSAGVFRVPGGLALFMKARHSNHKRFWGLNSQTKLRPAHTGGEVPATSPCNKSPEEFTRRDWSLGLLPRTVHTKVFWGTSRRDLSRIFKLVWIRETSRRDQGWSLRLYFEAKVASSHDGTCPRDLMQALVAGTDPLVCALTSEGTQNIYISVQGLTQFTLHGMHAVHPLPVFSFAKRVPSRFASPSLSWGSQWS